jgi:hypothetical protein
MVDHGDSQAQLPIIIIILACLITLFTPRICQLSMPQATQLAIVFRQQLIGIFILALDTVKVNDIEHDSLQLVEGNLVEHIYHKFSQIP